MRPIIAALAILCLTVSAPCAAVDPEDWETREIGEWLFGDNILDGECIITRDYSQGGKSTALSLFRGPDNKLTLMFKGAEWSVVDGEVYNMRLYVDNHGFTAPMTGVVSGDRIPRRSLQVVINGEVMSNFSRYFEAGNDLFLIHGSTIIADLPLDGPGRAMTALNRCANDVQALLEYRRAERERYADIPADPFVSPDTPDE